MKIGKERDAQVANFESQYSLMKKAVEISLAELGELDDKYNQMIRDFFSSMKSYRTDTPMSLIRSIWFIL